MGGRGRAGPGRGTGEALVSVDSWGGEGDEPWPAAPGDAADPVLVLGDACVDPIKAGLAAVLAVAHDPTLDPDVSAAVFAHQRTPRVPLEGDGHVTPAGTLPDPEPPLTSPAYPAGVLPSSSHPGTHHVACQVLVGTSALVVPHHLQLHLLEDVS